MLTDAQRQDIIRRYRDAAEKGSTHGMVRQLAEEFEVSRWTITDLIRGNNDVAVRIHAQLDELGQAVTGQSVLYDAEGKVKLQWVKSKKDDTAEAARHVFEAYKDKLPQVERRLPMRESFSDDYLSVIPFGDPHVGLHSWAEETGDDFDLKIAERDLCAAVHRLVNTSPETRHCLIANLGDYFHADNMDAQTWRSGHKLDVDSRWAKVLRIGLRAIRQCIESALERHETVTVINAIGNHDDHSSIFLTVALSHIYENEPRVVINDLPRAVHFHEFGKVMLAVTHGHSIKMAQLPLVSATEEPEIWGRTRFRYGLTGHIHHDSAKEYNGMKVESFRTLSARDAYAASHGYRSGRDMKCIVYHRDFGEVERHTVSIEMLRRSNAGENQDNQEG